MLTFVCFLWHRESRGFQLPAICDYTVEHVNILSHMLRRCVKVPHELVCVTDMPNGLEPQIRAIKLWDTYRELGGCYLRLRMFASDVDKWLGNDHFIMIDLDCVMVNDCTSLFVAKDDFRMNTYNSVLKETNDQTYNGSLIAMKVGARSEIWNDFNPITTPQVVQDDPLVIGSDQAWIRHRLGRNEKRFTNADGIYEARQVRNGLPEGAKIVFFSGKRDPSLDSTPWVRENWK